MQPLGSGAAWREAQALMAHLAHTKPLPQCSLRTSIQQPRPQQTTRLSDRAATIAPIRCQALHKPSPSGWNDCDIDDDLWEVLELATDDELESIHGILYGKWPA